MIVLMAGPTATGKTTAALELGSRLSVPVISVREVLVEMTGSPLTRRDLQRKGADLDRRTNGRWLLEYLLEHHSAATVVVDAVRTRRQTEPVLSAIPDSHLIYLTAHDMIRRNRYQMAAHADPVKQSTPFEAAENHPTERNVRELRRLAHSVLETDEMTVEEVVAEVMRQSGLDTREG